MSSFELFLFAHLGAFFCRVSTGAKWLMLSIGGLLGGAAAHAASFEDTMVGAENSAAARREGRRASTSECRGCKIDQKVASCVVKKVGSPSIHSNSMHHKLQF